MFVITGASGNTGKVVAESLLAAGKNVSVIGRSADRLQDLQDKGAKLLVGDVQDVEFLQDAFSGAGGVYLMIPPKYDSDDFRAYQRLVAENYQTALSHSKVPYAVTLSSYGAHASDGNGVVSGLYPLEQLLNETEGLNVLHLRAGYFFENFLGSVPLLQKQGILGGFPIAGDVKLNMVHTSDIGKAAAQHLVDQDFSGNQVIFLSNENAYTLQEAASILGAAIDRPDTPYIAFPADGAKQAMLGMGMSKSLVDNYIEFSLATSAGSLSEENNLHPTQHTSTSLSDFANIFSEVYHAQANTVTT